MLGDEVAEEVENRKSGKRRKRLIATIVVLVVLIAAAVGLLVFRSVTSKPATEEPQATQLEVGESAEDAAVAATEITEIPDLASLFGDTVDEALSSLPEGSTVSGTVEGSDEKVPEVKQIATIAIPATAEADGDLAEDVPAASELYLSLDEGGLVCKVYYAVPLDDLGNTDYSFAALLEDEELLEGYLSDAGVTPKPLDLDVPEQSEYQTVASDDADKVQKESYTYSGEASGSSVPSTWEVTYTFDYAQVNATGNANNLTRMLYISLY